jgi:hypothetical protein
MYINRIVATWNYSHRPHNIVQPSFHGHISMDANWNGKIEIKMKMEKSTKSKWSTWYGRDDKDVKVIEMG